jgi:hypothetical protein
MLKFDYSRGAIIQEGRPGLSAWLLRFGGETGLGQPQGGGDRAAKHRDIIEIPGRTCLRPARRDYAQAGLQQARTSALPVSRRLPPQTPAYRKQVCCTSGLSLSSP